MEHTKENCKKLAAYVLTWNLKNLQQYAMQLEIEELWKDEEYFNDMLELTNFAKENN